MIFNALVQYLIVKLSFLEGWWVGGDYSTALLKKKNHVYRAFASQDFNLIIINNFVLILVMYIYHGCFVTFNVLIFIIYFWNYILLHERITIFYSDGVIFKKKSVIGIHF